SCHSRRPAVSTLEPPTPCSWTPSPVSCMANHPISRGSTRGGEALFSPTVSAHVYSGGRIMRLSTLGLLVTLACGLGLFGTPLVATAQQPGKVYRIGFLTSDSPPLPSAPRTKQGEAFCQQLP